MKKLITFIALLTCFLGAKAIEIVDAEVDFSMYSDISTFKFAGWGASDLAKARLTIKDGCLHFHNEAVTDPTWGCQFHPIGGVNAEVGVTYTLHYKIKGSVAQKISVLGFGQETYRNFPITTNWVEGTIDYVAKNSDGNLLFQCGDYVGDYDIAYLKITHEEEQNPDDWEELLINGDFEGADFSSFKYMAEVDGGLAICDVTEEDLVADGSQTGRCLKITSSENARNYWDTQLYIMLDKPLAEGDKIKFSMRVKASQNTLMTSQAQSRPGEGIHWSMVGDINLTTAWQVINREITIDADHDGTQTIAFDLNQDKKAIDFYFDDISVKIFCSGNTPVNPDPVVDENELITNGNFEGSDFSSFKYMAEVDGGLAICDVTEEDLVADDSQTGRCLKITSSENAKNYWDTQLYIMLGKTLVEGDKIKFSMRAKASQNTLMTSQAQSRPGEGIHWSMVGDIDLTTTWQEINREITIDADHDGTQTIAFDLNQDKKAIDFYFDDISVTIQSGNTPDNPDPQPTDNNRLYSNGTSLHIGSTAKLTINMANEDSFTGYQFELELPDGITFAKDENGKYIVTKGNRYTDDSQQIKVEHLGDNTFRFVCISMQNATISGTDGELLTITIAAGEDLAEKDYTATIKNIVLSMPDETKLKPNSATFKISVKRLIKGDADGDGELDINDIVAMVNCIMGNPSARFTALAADMNDDGEIDIFDVIKAINAVLTYKSTARSKTRATRGTNEQAIVIPTANGVMLDVNDASRFTAFQFDVEVADDVELTEARLTADALSHNLHITKNGEKSYRVVGVSMDNSVLTSNGNGLVELSLSKGGSVQISNIVFVTPQENKVFFASGGAIVTGIDSIVSEKAEVIFDLSGRRVDSDRSRLNRGVYIINNKKVVIK